MKRTIEKTRVATLRCAVYTRKSTEEGLEQEFNSLDAQREAAESYIASQKHEGWTCLPTRYDDGGFTGGNMDRPALQRLLADIDGGKVDCIVVYKVDRLSRSLIDFSKIMDVLDRNKVSFVSVTQQFNTSTSMGRLMLNVLLSFAQFEREIISERTRDKIAAARKKGKWVGGRPILGFDIASNAQGGRVTVNEEEAAQVRQIYELYLQHRALLPTLREIDRRGWRTKAWVTKKGQTRGGKRFAKDSLYRLLTSVLYIGKVRYRQDIYEGEHPGIVSETLWHRVQDVLRHNGRSGGANSGLVRNKYGALLKGLLRCGPCGCGMMHTYTSKGNRRYRYYVCIHAQKRGWGSCPTKSVPAAEIERFVVERIKVIGKDDAVLAATLAQARKQSQAGLEALQVERRRLERELAQHGAEVRRLIDEPGFSTNGSGGAAARLADLQDRIRVAEQRATEVREQIIALSEKIVDEAELARALSLFDPVWDSLSPGEQARVLHLLVENVTYDGAAGSLAITFRPTGIKALAEELEAVAC
ncbi:MAG: recombinase family protein [Phycisphaeraceae bacterium]|nr:recombinase family protein [Phycisphaeraceae bacterium]